MGCFQSKQPASEKSSTELPRPLPDSPVSFEKPLLISGRSTSRPTASVPPAIASIRPTANPKYSAYAGAAERDEIHNDDGKLRYRGGRPDESGALSVDKKEDDVDDPEEKERIRKAEEARRKAEQEEQERRDFLQWM
ncbi:hypothetical protein OQA88_10709 [Cercophora sp. LCS_1]